MEPMDAAFERFKAFVEKVKEPTYWDSIKSEEDARMKIINPVFTDILGWPISEIHCESKAGKMFIDYRGTIKGLNRLIIEAKKGERELGINADHSARYFQLKGSVFHTEAAREGIDQAIRYCGHKNVELACLTNGEQWAIFKGRAKEGTDTMDNQACVFGSLDAITSNFKEFYELLSYESVESNTYRAIFQQKENQPLRQKTVKSVARSADSRQMVKADKLYGDLEKIMHTFFRDLDPHEDEEARRACFVTTSESDAAEKGLERISEELRAKVQELETVQSEELTEIIKRVKEMKRNELVLLVGTKGAGKTTFIDRFFADVLPSKIRDDCVVVRLDLSKSGGDPATVTSWLDEHFLADLEKATFPSGYPTYDELVGMCMGEYKWWSEGYRKHLYETDKPKFKDEFGNHIGTYFRRDRPRKYIVHLLFHIVRNHKKIPCIVFDNADHFDVKFQEAAFNYAHSICSDSICLMILPITDTTSWQLPKQGPMQSFYTDSFFLPTPPVDLIVRRRIEYIEKKVAEEQAESGKKPMAGKGYFLSRNIPFEIENIKGFAACLQTVFVNTGQVADWIGRLSNHDIRRALQLTCETVTSPHVKVAELFKAWVMKSTMLVKPHDVKNAMIRGKYDIYFPTVHSFIQNLFNLVPEYETTPLLGLRILSFLNNAWEANKDNDGRYVPVSEIQDFFQAMNIEPRATGACLEQMMHQGICLGYDPTKKLIKDVEKVEISPSGRQHVQWGTRDWVYIESMAEVTPLHDANAADTIRNCAKNPAPHLRRQVIGAFINYLLQEDSHFCVVPKHESYQGQEEVRTAMSQQVKALSSLASIMQTEGFHRRIGKVYSWKPAGFGFIKESGFDKDIYIHISDVLDDTLTNIPEGSHVEYEVVEPPRGPKAVNVVLLH
jgi:cold shock CspA family protein/energy-coupling factor transporter ATP-binding protein EcfA2